MQSFCTHQQQNRQSLVLRRQRFQSVGKHPGDGTRAICPVGLNRPLARSIENATMESDRWLAAKRNFPDGSIAKFRGVFPPLGTCSIGSSRPDATSNLKEAMLSCPRLEAYTNLPSGCTCISAQVLSPEKPAGTVETVCTSRSVPFAGS